MQPFTAIKYNYFSTKSLCIRMHLCHLQMSLKIQLRLKSGTCIHNRFWQSIPISVTRHFSKMSSFSHAAVHPPSMCWAEIIMDVYSTIFELSASLYAMLHYHYTINIHLYQMAVIFNGGNMFHHSSLNTESHYKLPYRTKFPILFPLHIYSSPEQHLMTDQLTLHHLLHLGCTSATS